MAPGSRRPPRASPRGKLALTWPGRERLLLGVDPDGTPRWATPDRPLPGTLVESQRVGRIGSGPPNRLIQGDNLVALRKLSDELAGAVQFIYIDPPFNTGNAFAHYADDLDDSLWLSMMAPRVEALRGLLRREGLIAVHIDHRELAPLKLLMDEVFGKENFVSLITVKVKDPAGVGQQSAVFDVCEYLLLYARDLPRLRLDAGHDLIEARPQPPPVKGYRKALLDFGEPRHVKTVHRPRAGEIRIFRCPGYRVKTFGPRDSAEGYLLHFDRIFADYNATGGLIRSLKEDLPPATLSYIEYVPSKGRTAGAATRVYFLNRRILAWLKDTAEIDGANRIVRRSRLTNLWEMSNAQLFAEGGVEFRQGKKAEALVSRLLGLATRPGDWVLDSFLGSGTTAAVAHKMGRRWIGIELGAHAETHCLPRLSRVVSGADRTGISKAAGWKGGGGFVYSRLEE